MTDTQAGVIIGLKEGYESYCRKNGLPIRSLTEGSVFRGRTMPSPEATLKWTETTPIFRNLYALQNEVNLTEVLREMLVSSPSTKFLKRTLGAMATPTAVYRTVYNWIGPRMNRNMSSSFAVQADGSVEIDVTLHDGQEPCFEFFKLVEHSLIVQCAMIGAGNAIILSSQVTATGIHTRLIPPPSTTLLARFRRFVRRLIDPDMGLTLLVSNEINSVKDEANEAIKGLTTLYESLPDGVIVLDQKTIIDCNPAMLSILGLRSTSDLKGQVLTNFSAPEDRTLLREFLEAPVTPSIECRFVTDDGVVRLEVRRVGRIQHQRSLASFFILRDLSAVRNLETKLTAQQRLAVMGELGAALTHELASPLAVIQSNLQSYLTPGPTFGDQALLNDTLDHCTHVQSLLGSFGNYFRHSSKEISPCNVSAILSEALNIARLKARRSKVQIDLSPVDNALLVKCRSHELVQGVVNVLSNAIDASRHAHATQKKVHLSVTSDSVNVRIVITNPGKIQRQDVKVKMWEPFFSTKDGGMGLGLTLSRKLIEEHGGTLSLDEGAPTTSFKIELPLHRDRNLK